MAIGRIIGRVAIKVIPDTTDFRDDVADDLKRIERELRSLDVDVVPNVSEEAERKVRKDLERWAKKISPLKIDVRPDLTNGMSALISARLAVLTRPRDAEIIPRLNEGAAAKVGTMLAALSGARVLSDIFDDVWDSLKNLDKSVPIIGSIALAIAGLAGYGLSASSNLFALSASLAQMGGAALGLPGILGGMAIGLGATIAVFKDFNKVIPEMKTKLSELQDQMSSKFWAQAEQPIRNMIDTLFPIFSSSIQGVSTQLGKFFGNFASSLGKLLAPDLKSMFDDLSESIDIAGQHTDSFAQIIATLGSLGAGLLPRLAGWFGDISDQFNGWLNEAKADGTLQKWVDDGIFAIQELGRALGNIGGILNGLSDAAIAAGGSNLTMFADTLQSVEDTVKSANFQTTLTGVLRAAHEMMSQISSGSGPQFKSMVQSIADLFIKIGPQIGDTIGTALGAISAALASPAISNGLEAMFSGLNSAVHKLAPAMQPLAEMLGSLGPVIGALANNIGSVLAAAIILIQPTFVALTTALTPLINMLGPLLTNIIQSLTPVFAALAEQLPAVGAALQPLILAVQNLWNVIAPLLVPVLQFLVQILGETLILAINGVTDVINGLAEFIGGIVDFFDDLFHGRFDQLWGDFKNIISGAVTAVWGAIKTWIAVGAVKLVKGAFDGIIAFCKSFGPSMKTLLGELWSSLIGRMSTAWNTIKATPGQIFNAILSFLKGIVGDIKAAFSLAWEQLPAVVRTYIGIVKTVVTTIPTMIKNVFTGAGSLLKSVGSKIIQGLIDGIGSMFGKVKDKLKSLTDKLTSWKGPEPVDRVLLTPAGELIIAGLIQGFENMFPDVRSSLSDLTNMIAKSAGRAVAGTSEDIGSTIGNGMIDGLSSSRRSVLAETVSMAEEIAKVLSKTLDKTISVGIAGDVSASVQPIGLTSRLSGLEASISSAAAAAASDPATAGTSIQIDNITIPLEDLAQLKTLEEFLELLRVRARQEAS